MKGAEIGGRIAGYKLVLEAVVCSVGDTVLKTPSSLVQIRAVEDSPLAVSPSAPASIHV